MPMEATSDHKLNISLLSKKLAKAAWWSTFWAKIAGFQEITNVNGIRQTNPAPNSIVQVLRDFVQEGRDNMLLPFINPYSEAPVYGDTWLKGTGEEMTLRYLRVYINQVRKAVMKKTGRMSAQRLKGFQIMEQAMPELIKYWSKWYNAAMFQTLYEGLSPQLTAGTLDEGNGIKARFHPNMYYYANSDVLTPVGTAGKTKTQAEWETADALITNDSNAELLSQLNMLVKTDLLIDPAVTKGGMEFWFYMVHPRSMKKFKQDDDIQAANNSAYMHELKDHPALAGRDYLYYDGFCVVEERTGCRTMPPHGSASVDLLDMLAGKNGWTMPPNTATNTLFSGIILGRDALGLGVAENLNFTEETDDHGNVEEIGSQCIQGANRVEFFSETDEATVFATGGATKAAHTTAYTATNQSSAIIWTKD